MKIHFLIYHCNVIRTDSVNRKIQNIPEFRTIKTFEINKLLIHHTNDFKSLFCFFLTKILKLFHQWPRQVTVFPWYRVFAHHYLPRCCRYRPELISDIKLWSKPIYINFYFGDTSCKYINSSCRTYKTFHWMEQ